MKSKKKLLAVSLCIIQIILLFFWAVIIAEYVRPVYKWDNSVSLIGQNITVNSPKRAETFLTSSAKKFNNQRFASANSEIYSAFTVQNKLSKEPEHKVLKNNGEVFIYELFSDEQPQRWTVSVYFGNENAFDIFVDTTGGVS